MSSEKHDKDEPGHPLKRLPIRFIPLTMGLSIFVLILKIFHIPAHIQAWRSHQSFDAAYQTSTPPSQGSVIDKPHAQNMVLRNAFPDKHHFQHAQQSPSQPSSKPLKIQDLNQEEIQVLMNLNKERNQLLKNQKSFKQKEIALKAIQDKISEKISDFKNNKKQDENTLQKNNEFHEKAIATLVKTYESMKPKVAAQLLQEMDTQLVMLIVPQLKPAKLTAVMTAMDPEAARQLTRKLSESGLDLPQSRQKGIAQGKINRRKE